MRRHRRGRDDHRDHRLPPAIRPGLHCGNPFEWVLKPIKCASPGHQAGAPLRRRGRRRAAGRRSGFPRPSGRGSIAAGIAPPVPEASPSFPRPSGRGSIAAGRPRYRPPVRSATSPGHQAGAPLRHRSFGWFLFWGRDFPRPSGRGSIAAITSCSISASLRPLPPAIRPGLHCGEFAAPWDTSRGAGLPPAIRPGLHCGNNFMFDLRVAAAASPGHQAGAPLRRVRRAVGHEPRRGPSPGHQAGAPLRPGGPRRHGRSGYPSPGHQAGAPLRPPVVRRVAVEDLGFPRPSGRGSIAAATAGSPRWTTASLPPAIRPGLHCGMWRHDCDVDVAAVFPRPSGRGSIAA